MSIISIPQHSINAGASGTGKGIASARDNTLQMAAEQFEALFLQQVLKQMRKASDALSTDSPMRSRELDTMRDLYDGVLADNLAGQKQGGIADLLVKQLSGAAGPDMNVEQAGAAARSAELPQRTASLIDPLRNTWRRSVDTLSNVWQQGSANFKTLVDSVVRHESGGRVDAVSPKGALGVMQLMPDTARDMAAELGLSFSQTRLSSDAGYNKQLGSAYLGKMLARYDGEPALAVAAYNAGPARVDDWLQNYGDPRRGDLSVSAWVARIPFQETRDYASNILRDLRNAASAAASPESSPVSNVREAVAPIVDEPGSAAAVSSEQVRQAAMNSMLAPLKPASDSVALHRRAADFTGDSLHQSRSAAFAQLVRIERTETDL
jgi:soluble lytic murein transglycosylase